MTSQDLVLQLRTYACISMLIKNNINKCILPSCQKRLLQWKRLKMGKSYDLKIMHDFRTLKQSSIKVTKIKKNFGRASITYKSAIGNT